MITTLSPQDGFSDEPVNEDYPYQKRAGREKMEITPAVPCFTKRSERNKTILLFILIFFLSTVFFCLHRPASTQVLPVAGHHYYLARQIYQGQLLYRDLFIDKPPLTELLGALCFLICSGDLLPSIILTRFVFFYFFLFSAVPLFFIARRIINMYYPAWLVVVIYLSFNFPYEKLAVSADWHVLMVFFGLTSVAFFLGDRLIISGLFASLSLLSWQPGVIFIISLVTAVLLFSRRRIRKDLMKLLGVFLIPFAILILYTWIRGNLRDMIEQTILYGRINVSDEFLVGLRMIPRRINISYSRNLPVLILGVVGFILNWVRVGVKGKESLKRYFFPLSLFSMMILISLVDFQSSRDVIPALPWISLYAVYLIYCIPGRRKLRLFRTVLSVSLVGLAIYSISGPMKNNPYRFTLEKQEARIRAKMKRFGLRKGESVLCMESILPCLFLNRKNLTRHVYYLQDKHYQFIQAYEENGFSHVLDAIQRDKPRLVQIRQCPWSKEDWLKERFDPLRELLADNYTQVEAPHLWLYVRK